MLILQSVVGLCLLIALCYAFSENRADIRYPIILKSLLLQILFALILLKLPASQSMFVVLNDGITVLQAATQEGTTFIFGYLGGGELPFSETVPGAS
ncbi:MAG: nucleoside:proton symporter, partial [Gammaproteobacteria bacterium]|nr:nucleoside:proton symporter [Gammaproteobacteria bacterium]